MAAYVNSLDKKTKGSLVGLTKQLFKALGMTIRELKEQNSKRWVASARESATTMLSKNSVVPLKAICYSFQKKGHFTPIQGK